MSHRLSRLLFLLMLLSCAIGCARFDQGVELSSEYVSFLSAEEAADAILDDRLEPFFNRLQTLEMSGGTGRQIVGDTLTVQRTVYRKRYRAAVRDFSEEEKVAVCWVVEGVRPLLEEQFPLFAQMPWSFLKTDGSVVGGMPHTRDRHIIFSQGVVSSIVRAHKRDRRQGLTPAFSSLFVHEQMHVFQRTHPGFFDSLYKDVWGFVHARAVESNAYLDKYQMLNPDGTDLRWIFRSERDGEALWLLPLLMLREGAELNISFGQMRMVVVEMEESGWSRFRPKTNAEGMPLMAELLKTPEYTERFEPSKYIYHPHEACADLFTRVFMSSVRGRPQEVFASMVASREKDGALDPRLEPLRKWFSEHFAVR